MNTKRVIYGIIFLSLFCFATPDIVFSAESYTLLESLPGAGEAEKETTFPEYVKGIYSFATGFVIIAALLMVSIGGFYYITSAGNQAQAGSAKKIITDALLGLVVVFIAWLVLYTINEDLVGASPTVDNIRSDGTVNPDGTKKLRNVTATSKEHSDPDVSYDSTGVQTYCEAATTTIECHGTKEECIKEAGSDGCTESANAFLSEKNYSCKQGFCEEFDSLKDCEASGATNCVTGTQAKVEKLYNTRSNDEIESDIKNGNGEISADAKKNLNKMTEKTVDNATALSDNLRGEISSVSSQGNLYTLKGDAGTNQPSTATRRIKQAADSDPNITALVDDKNPNFIKYRYEYAANHPDKNLAGTIILRTEKKEKRNDGQVMVTYSDLEVYASQKIKTDTEQKKEDK